MSLAEVERIKLELSKNERALLAATILESGAPDSPKHLADEFKRREREMDEGTVAEISYELVKRVKLYGADEAKLPSRVPAWIMTQTALDSIFPQDCPVLRERLLPCILDA